MAVAAAAPGGLWRLLPRRLREALESLPRKEDEDHLPGGSPLPPHKHPPGPPRLPHRRHQRRLRPQDRRDLQDLPLDALRQREDLPRELQRDRRHDPSARRPAVAAPHTVHHASVVQHRQRREPLEVQVRVHGRRAALREGAEHREQRQRRGREDVAGRAQEGCEGGQGLHWRRRGQSLVVQLLPEGLADLKLVPVRAGGEERGGAQGGWKGQQAAFGGRG